MEMMRTNRGILRAFYFVILPNLSHPDPPQEGNCFSIVLKEMNGDGCCWDLGLSVVSICRLQHSLSMETSAEMQFASEFIFIFILFIIVHDIRQ